MMHVPLPNMMPEFSHQVPRCYFSDAPLPPKLVPEKPPDTPKTLPFLYYGGRISHWHNENGVLH